MAKSKNYGGLIFLLLVLIGGGAGVWYYFKGRAEQEPTITAVKVSRGDITQSVTATGDLQPVVQVDIGAQVSGQIEEVLVDFNSVVKAGDVLARIDKSTPEQKLRQAEADLASAEASNLLAKTNAQRQRELFERTPPLVTQSELDSAVAQLAQSNASLLTRKAAVETAKLDLSRTIITAPIDGMILNRATDVGRTVNASTNAPTLFTIVNDLSKMQINAAVAEADIGLIKEGQPVRFTVDAFPNDTFNGLVRQVRNAATANQSVVSYATIIDVSNEQLRLKPGMTANVSIIVQEKRDVLRVANQALRLRMTPELQAKYLGTAPATGKADAKADPKAPAAKAGAPVTATMTDSERRRAAFDIQREVGFQAGETPATPEQLEKARQLAKDRGLDPDQIAASFATAGRGGRGFGGRGGRGGRGGGGGGFGGGGGGGGDRGFNNTIVTRTVYRLVDPAAKVKKLEAVQARLGVSDGITTEVLDGLNEGDSVVTLITPAGAAPIMQAPQGGMQNPFQGGRGGGGGGGMRGGGR